MKKRLKKTIPPKKSAKQFAAPSPSPSVAAPSPNNPARLLDRHEVQRRVPFTYPTLWKWMCEGKFPRSLNAGGKIVWREDEIENWIKSRPPQPLKGDNAEATS